MTKSLVIVESPAKAKTIGKFLGRNFKVTASVGHVRDLPKSKLGIDIDNNFEPQYITIRGKGPVLSELRKEAKKADRVLLATDPDREGEAISWHLAHILNLDYSDKNRIEFNEITKNAITKAVKNPRQINQKLVDAQQARRVLDRLVGYKISPLLWRNIRRGLSAGRVQSVATKLICDRENEIEIFKPEEYWSLDVVLKKAKSKFEATFVGEVVKNKDKKIELKQKEETDEIIKRIQKNDFIVEEVKTGTKKRNPYPPFITSSLQQDASKRIGFTTKKTMRIAQQLYEGIDIKGKGTIGLITYIRTDSVRLSSESIDNTKDFLNKEFGEEYSSGGRQFHKSKNKSAQDAHEAIRPSEVNMTPDTIKDSLSRDQYKLYKLIWERFVASQMTPAVYETLTVRIKSGDYIFRASGSKIKFDGFMKVYNITNKEKDIKIPSLKDGDKLDLVEIDPQQHFTQPPPRFTEASLVKTLEELGIGRPSTYAPTISTILSRGYVIVENKSLKPTELGIIVTELLKKYFKDIVNEEFTAAMEEKFDKIEESNVDWKSIIKDFYKDFSKVLEVAENEISKIEIQDEETDEVCDKCGSNMVIKHGRYGKFLACPGYPECKNTKPIVQDVGVKCLKCGGDIIQRRSKKGRTFFGCSKYPECDFVSWDKPIDEKCPDCGSLLSQKTTKNGIATKCTSKDCKYKKIEEKS